MRSIDSLWVEHLTTMDNMRQGIGLQAVGQRNPLIQYKKTGFEFFENLLERINRDVSINLLPFSASLKKTKCYCSKTSSKNKFAVEIQKLDEMTLVHVEVEKNTRNVLARVIVTYDWKFIIN